MIDRIIDFSARNRALVLSLVTAAGVLGWWSMKHVPLDALPDLNDTQVIVYSRWERDPEVINAQITYPIVSAMLGAPRVKSVRGFSDFGYSFVYVVFKDGTDIYWARSRVVEYLSPITAGLPAGVKAEIGPDASGLGWVFQYVLQDHSGKHSLADLRSLQDWYIRYYLKSVPGVAEVAPLGGFGKQYQVNVDPLRLQQYRVSMNRVVDAIRSNNDDTSGRLIEFGETEYMVRGRGYVKGLSDLENIVVSPGENGAPIRIRDIGQVVFGPDLRRGTADLDGKGNVVSGIVVMRQGENALDVINAVKGKIREIAPGLPDGVQIVPVYDRSELIHHSIDTLKTTVIEIILSVCLVVLIFLSHPPSAIVPMITIPTAVLLTFIPFYGLGLTANVMSLGGIAIAIGTLVDAAIVVVEQAHKKLERWEDEGYRGDYRDVVIQAVKDVGGTSFYALLVIAVSFLPILALEAHEGRLFKPLAYTKTLAMVVGALLTITLDPALRLSLTRIRQFQFRPRWLARVANRLFTARVRSEERHTISRWLIAVYEPVCQWSLRHKALLIGSALGLLAATVPVFTRLGSEFMPSLYEETLFYMPSLRPGVSIAEAQRTLQLTDGIIKRFPEVRSVLGKAGRAETSTDPAPLSMLETLIALKPRSEWRHIPTWYSSWAPEWSKPVFRHFSSDTISPEALGSDLDRAVKVPGVSNAWTMPIKARMDMLTTGIRTSVGLKIHGSNLKDIEAVAQQIVAVLPSVRGTRNVFAERSAEGYFLDIVWNREALAKYGVSIDDAQMIVRNAIGGENVSTAVDGPARYPINARYMRDYRSDIAALRSILVPAPGQEHVPLSDLATIQRATGPAMIRNEDGLLTGYVYVDIGSRDAGTYVQDAKQALSGRLSLPPGYAVTWSGQYEAMQRASRRLSFVLPLTGLLIIVLLYINTRSIVKTAIVILAVPFSAIGAIWFLYFLGYNMSVAVWVGLIALLGIDAETGVFMLLYLELSYSEAQRAGRLTSLDALREAIVQGAAKRIRPKVMTVTAAFIGLIPIMWATGTGSDVMKRIAAPFDRWPV